VKISLSLSKKIIILPERAKSLELAKDKIQPEINMNRVQSNWILIIVIIGLIFSLISCSKKGSGKDGDDGNTPYMILDLRVYGVTDSSVSLKWTATGDDADVGRATSYDMRYYHTWISTANWDSAMQVTGESEPSTAGQTDSMKVTGLKKDSTYYFALIAFDEAGNSSGISNNAVATCFTDLVVTFPDSNLEGAIRTLISKPSGDIYRSDLMVLTFLDANNTEIDSLRGLEYCTNLVAIFLNFNSVSDLGPISDLIKLQDVQFAGNDIVILSPLASLVNIGRLNLAGNLISDISALSGLTALHILSLDNNNISDLSPLVANSGIGMNDTLYLTGNPLSQQSINSYIPTLESRGVTIIH
jgi:Leucine-rich repeat (LRR) protein